MLAWRIIGKYYLTHGREFFLRFGSQTVPQSRCARRAGPMSCAHVNGIQASTRNVTSDSKMSGSRNLAGMTGKELQRFLDSFDVVFSDCDGEYRPTVGSYRFSKRYFHVSDVGGGSVDAGR